LSISRSSIKQLGVESNVYWNMWVEDIGTFYLSISIALFIVFNLYDIIDGLNPSVYFKVHWNFSFFNWTFHVFHYIWYTNEKIKILIFNNIIKYLVKKISNGIWSCSHWNWTTFKEDILASSSDIFSNNLNFFLAEIIV
jgi:hypothetical protein